MMEEQGSGRSALVLYATETGTAQDLAGEIEGSLLRLRFDVDAGELDRFTHQQLHDYDLVVFVIPTTGQGDFPSNGVKFWTSLLRKKLTSTTLDGITYALVGLGDSSYFKFNWAARKLEKRLKQLGAQQLLDPCEADEQGEEGTEGFFLAWLSEFRDRILSIFPLPNGDNAIPDDIPLKSKWVLEEVPDSIGSKVQGSELPIEASSEATSFSQDSFTVTVLQNDRVTPSTHWQDVRFLRLETTQQIDYRPGDALAILPKNLSEDVGRLITMMGWEDTADKHLTFANSKALKLLPLPMYCQPQARITLRSLLTEQLDINAIPRRSFFSAIAKYTTDEMHKERLLEFTEPQYLDEYFDYATRPRRSILEVLQEFDSVKIPWQDIISVFPALRPRQFSIASGGVLKSRNSGQGTAFDLLIAIVKYKTVIKRIREGVCTRYLARLPAGTAINVTLRTEGRFYPRKNQLCNNHILIGAGTGIAPLRSLINEKYFVPSVEDMTVLIFGARSSKSDFYFENEWAKLDKTSNNTTSQFHLITAFSRDQREKIYVQDRIREHGSLISKLILENNATIIICGSSGQMPKAVKQAIKDVLVDQSKQQSQDKNGLDDVLLKDDEDAERFINLLEKQGRFKQETWS